METAIDVIKLFITTIILASILSLLIAIPVMILWNWLMPVIFGLTEITVFQAFGLSILSAFLFKSRSTTKED